ncbi:hypothetical protein [Roseovarius dicentrarchi]|uniref:hypothetical protein n=1 Tax=Roseovarius dicentrarchi TaxID=2250573 RepID=UPI00139671B8|nr:hypothetical protein [Roseovarius dicentrarchi]
MAQVLAPVGGGSNVGEAVRLADGGFMVVWQHLTLSIYPIPNVADEDGAAVLGRVFNADGTPRGAVFQVNQSLVNSGQGHADIAVLNNGNVVAVWTDGPNFENFDVAARGRILSPTGAPITDEFDLATTTDRDQNVPQVTANDKGGFFTTWSDGRAPWSNTKEQWIGQEFDASGNRLDAEIWTAAAKMPNFCISMTAFTHWLPKRAARSTLTNALRILAISTARPTSPAVPSAEVHFIRTP